MRWAGAHGPPAADWVRWRGARRSHPGQYRPRARRRWRAARPRRPAGSESSAGCRSPRSRHRGHPSVWRWRRRPPWRPAAFWGQPVQAPGGARHRLAHVRRERQAIRRGSRREAERGHRVPRRVHVRAEGLLGAGRGIGRDDVEAVREIVCRPAGTDRAGADDRDAPDGPVCGAGMAVAGLSWVVVMSWLSSRVELAGGESRSGLGGHGGADDGGLGFERLAGEDLLHGDRALRSPAAGECDRPVGQHRRPVLEAGDGEQVDRQPQ